MKRFILSLLLGAGLIAGVQAVAASPASAGTCTYVGPGYACGNIYHAPDAGYDDPILIRCDYGDNNTNHLLYEGVRSTSLCKDTDQVYVRTGEEIWCNYPRAGQAGPVDMWAKVFDATGWHKINDIWNDGAGCNLRVD